MPSITLVVSDFPKLSETFIVSKFVGLTDAGENVQMVAETIDSALWDSIDVLKGRQDLRSRVWGNRSPRQPARAWRHGANLLHVLRHCRRALKCYILNGLRYRGWRVFGTFFRDLPVICADPRVLHFEFGSLATNRYDLAKLLESRMTVSFRGYDLNYVALDVPGYYDKVWKFADGIHFLGADLEARAVRRGLPRDPFRVRISPAIDARFFSRNGEREAGKKLRILSVGRLEWKKGYEYAIGAMERLKKTGVSFEYRIIGAGEYLEAIAFCIHQLGLEKEVLLVGAANRVQIRDVMESSDIFLHAAVSEGFCNAVLEAQAMELPVVTSDADGLAENVIDGETGFVVPRRNVRRMAEALEILARDRSLGKRMGRAGRARVVESFQAPQQIRAFQEFYRQVEAQAS